MLGIKVNDTSLYLPADFGITIEDKNPMFYDDGGVVTRLPVRIPRCPHNDELLSHWHDIRNASVADLQPAAKIYIDGNIKYSGRLVLLNANNKYFETYFKSNRANFNTLAKEFNLNDSTYQEKLSDYAWTDNDFGTDIRDYTLGFYGTYNVAFFMIYMPNMNYTPSPDENRCKFINFFSHTWCRFSSSVYTTISPQFYLKFVIAKIIEEMGYQVGYNYFNSSDVFNQLTVENTNYNLGFTGLVGSYASFERDLPSTTAYEFIKAVEKEFNVGFFPDDETKTVDILSVENEIITTSDEVDITQYIKSEFRKENRDNFGIKIIPSIDSSDDWEEEAVWIDNDENITITGEVETYDDLPAPSVEGAYYMVKTENKLYKTVYQGSYSWVEMGINHVTDKEGVQPFNEIEQKASTLFMLLNETDYLEIFSTIPQKVYLPAYMVERQLYDGMYDNKSGKIKFMFYHGFVVLGVLHGTAESGYLGRYFHLGTVETETDIPAWNGGGLFQLGLTAQYIEGVDPEFSTKVYVLNSDKTYYLRTVGSYKQWTETSNDNDYGFPWNAVPFGSSMYYYYTQSEADLVTVPAAYRKYDNIDFTLWNSGDDGIAETYYTKTKYWYLNIREKGEIDILWPENLKVDFTKKYKIRNNRYIIDSLTGELAMTGKKISILKLVRV